MPTVTETLGKEVLNLTKEQFIRLLKDLPFEEKKIKAQLLAEWLKLKGLKPTSADFRSLETK